MDDAELPTIYRSTAEKWKRAEPEAFREYKKRFLDTGRVTRVEAA